MKAIILAAGFGNRMRPLSDAIHKTLIQVGNDTIIGRIIDGLLANDVKDVLIVTGYRADELRQYLAHRFPNTRFNYVHNERYRETNNIHSLALALNSYEIDEDILLIESDLVYENSVIRKILKSNYANVALVDRFRNGMDGTVVTVVNHVIMSIIPPHLQDEKFDFSDKYKTLNIYKFSKEFCATQFKKLLTFYSHTFDDNCYYELILGMLIYLQRETIYAEIIEDEKWSEIDDPNDLRVAEFIFNRSQRLEILETTFGGYWSHDILDFCFIRNMYFPNSSVLSEMKNSLADLVQNYGSRQSVLDYKLSIHLLCNPERVILLNGVSQIYPWLPDTIPCVRPLIPDPTFGEYKRIFRNPSFYADDVGFDLDEIRDRSEGCDLIVFVNPNNPTGSIIDSQWIHDFAGTHPDKTILVDESFIDFSPAVPMIDLLEKQPLANVLVIKSLSKSLGVPGLRLGYCYSADSSFLDAIHVRLPIWNTNSMAEYFLEIILKHRKAIADSFVQTMADKEMLRTEIMKMPFVRNAYPGGGNYILVEFSESLSDPRALTQTMLENHSLYIKDVTSRFRSGKTRFRFAVRTPEENRFLTNCIMAYFNNAQENPR